MSEIISLKIINKKENQENLLCELSLATIKDWEVYKELRLEAISGKYQDIFGSDPAQVEKESKRTPQEWQDDLSSEDMFVVLAWNKNMPIGMAKASRKENEIWKTQSGYVKEEYQDQGVGQKLFAFRILEMEKRGAKQVIMMVEASNDKSIKLNEKLGFRKTTKEPQFNKMKDGRDLNFFKMEMDLTEDVVIQSKKILY